MEKYAELVHESITEKHKKRYHMNVDFFSSPLTLDLFDVYQICDLACSSDYEFPKHKQLCYEISYIVSGEGTFFRSGSSYTVYPNMLFFVNDQDIHYIKSSKNNPLRYMCLGFTFHKDHPDFHKYEKLCSFFDNLKTPLTIDNYKTFELFTLALKEISAPDYLSMELFESYILQIIIHTYRNLCNQTCKPYTYFIETDNTNPLIYEITNYIDSNLTNIKKLTDISNVFDYSYGYLSKLFSQTMGITIKGYYTQRRFEKAVEMLSEDMSISSISEKLYFADVPSFCKAFKQYYHVSPKKYQSLIRKNSENNKTVP